MLVTLRGRYGNYVVQRMMEHSRGTERERIFRTLNALPMDYRCKSQIPGGCVPAACRLLYLRRRRSNQHGMHIMNALQKALVLSD